MDIDLRLLRYLTAVARERSFTRAAEQLAITQPALSRAIRSLEDSVGVDLLVRGSRGVETTPAGNVLLEETRGIPAQIRVALEHARAVALNEEKLRLTVQGCDIEVAAQLAESYQPDYSSGIKTRVGVTANVASPADSLRQGTCDIALMRDPFDTTDLDWEPLLSEPRVALLSSMHPLSGKPQVALEELHDDPITVWPSMTATELAYWAGADEDGHPWYAGPRVSSATEMVASVRLNQAVAFVPASWAPGHAWALPGLRVRQVLGLSPSTLSVAWLANATSPQIARFVQYAAGQGHKCLPSLRSDRDEAVLV